MSSNSVVLPEPFGPMTPTMVGDSTTKSASSENVTLRSEGAAGVALGQRLDAQERGSHSLDAEQALALRGVCHEVARGSMVNDDAEVHHVGAIRDRERALARSARRRGPRPLRSSGAGSSSSRPARPWAPAPGSARRTARDPGRRPARARSRPSASRRRTGSRTRDASGTRARRRSRSTPSRSSRESGSSCARWTGCAPR